MCNVYTAYEKRHLAVSDARRFLTLFEVNNPVQQTSFFHVPFPNRYHCIPSIYLRLVNVILLLFIIYIFVNNFANPRCRFIRIYTRGIVYNKTHKKIYLSVEETKKK